jgi:nucleotide-binding universal stress UspA family protein
MAMRSYRTILCGVDRSAAAAPVLDHAATLARALGARLVVAHAVEGLEPVLPSSPENRAAVARLRAQLVAAATTGLGRLLARSRTRGVEAETVVLSGPAHAALLRHARRCRVDLIVLGTHGGGLARQLFVGSTAQRVVRQAPCPVVLVSPGTQRRRRRRARGRRSAVHPPRGAVRRATRSVRGLR